MSNETPEAFEDKKSIFAQWLKATHPESGEGKVTFVKLDGAWRLQIEGPKEILAELERLGDLHKGTPYFVNKDCVLLTYAVGGKDE